jgi:DNA/RNA-binding domain of Phe-tRNA-synthetase-like protein
MPEPIVSDRWRNTYPNAHVGILAMESVTNPASHERLDAHKKEIERQLCARYEGYDRPMLRALPVMQAYHAYYKRFKKTYHVQLQLESVVLKGKSIPRVAALVECMFMAELKNLLLTAGHDLRSVRLPITIDAAAGDERFVRMNGQEQALKAGDMLIADTEGILSSVIYGPDRRTQITPQTTEALFTVYAPRGVGDQAVREHLHDIRDFVRLIAPQAEISLLEVYGASQERQAHDAARLEA